MRPPVAPLRLVPDLRGRVWGGARLASLARPAPQGHDGEVVAASGKAGPIGEAWIVWDGCVVAGGPLAGRSLAEIVAADPSRILGPDGIAQADGRFPVLAKILDTTDWLSLQVHPDDATAVRLEGPGHLGKTEAWYVIDAQPGAELILGTIPGTSDEAVRSAIRDGRLEALVAHVPVHAGDAVLVRAGLLHAIGPGVLLYELQQSSDITYRVSDWGRPASAGRSLHVAQSILSVRPSLAARLRPTVPGDDDRMVAIACEKFVADLVAIRDAPAPFDTQGRSFHAVTVIAGGLVAEGEDWSEPLNAFESLLVPAATGRYALRPVGGAARAVVARVP